VDVVIGLIVMLIVNQISQLFNRDQASPFTVNH